MFLSLSQQSAAIIQTKVPNLTPKTAIILGSGLGELANHIKNGTVISYHDLPGFVASTIEGHVGQLVLGELYGQAVVCLQGRVHLYEGISPTIIVTMLQTLKLLGCEKIIITGAAGSLDPKIQPGSLMCLKDHINLQFSNPLAIKGHEADRFVSLEDAYDPELRVKFLEIATDLGIALPMGVYMGVLGPSFETPAEIRAFRLWGADCVGMSVVPEVIAARYCKLKVAAIMAISNMAAGLNDEKLSHQLTLRGAKQASDDLIALIAAFCKNTI